MISLESDFIKFLFCCMVACYAQEREVNNNDNKPPKDCNLNPREALESYETVEDFDRCAPFLLPDYARIYFQAAAGRQFTIKENSRAYKRLRILPQMLVDVSHLDLSVTVLGQKISMPIGADPLAFQRLASDLGEVDTVRATYQSGTIMVLSALSTTLIEQVAKAAPYALKWMQTYIFPNRYQTISLVRRAEASGFKAIVVTVDSPIPGPLPENARGIVESNPKNETPVNLFDIQNLTDASLTFRDLAWLKRQTRLPIVAKGILTPGDAVRAARYGASAILVSNHGGRQLDYVPATIDVLPSIVSAVKHQFPRVEVYVDGGIRNGFDVFKALARGAKMVFFGRPIVWGLAAGGQAGVKKVYDILRRELNETMTLAGTPSVQAIEKDMVVKEPCCTDDDFQKRLLYPPLEDYQISKAGYKKFLQ